MNVESKRCPRCEESLALEAFGRHKGRDDGLQDYCKPCTREYAKQWDRRKRQERRELKNPAVPAGFKRCRGCGEVKPHSEWHRSATASDGLAARCKACKAVQGRVGHLKRQYGMTEAERDEMVASQMGVCCICLDAPAEYVDHCHETGRVRGVLCFSCNAALGQFKDRPDAIRRAAAYVEGIAWKPTLVAPGVYQLPS
ncbi:endonuclease VII domain-containing protein [Streptomyces sp. NBC_01361]|uniref:endonuclease VII domain-containing protein n=1 Tax=Streptomyces sp. NBC_01361 TaxID=2903838 RepID=UPI002E33CCC2|nr:endonuclease VII domain-containing protein [Streptomyces sp. NBC_01361]